MLEVKHLKKSHGRKVILDDVSFSVERGQITALVGVNGVGKTTTMHSILNLIHYDEGEITLDGKPITDHSYNEIAYVPDELIIDQKQTIQSLLDDMAEY